MCRESPHQRRYKYSTQLTLTKLDTLFEIHCTKLYARELSTLCFPKFTFSRYYLSGLLHPIEHEHTQFCFLGLKKFLQQKWIFWNIRLKCSSLYSIRSKISYDFFYN